VIKHNIIVRISIQTMDSPGSDKLLEGYVESYIATGTGLDPDVATTTADHGKPPSPVLGMKRESGTPGET
jgi:hypothetical protein